MSGIFMDNYAVSGNCLGLNNHVFMTGVAGFSGSYAYAYGARKEPEPNTDTHDWVNDPSKGGQYIYALGSEDPIYEIINGKTYSYQRRWVPKKKFPSQDLGPRENIRPAPTPKGIKKEVRIAGFGANQKLKL